MAQKYLGSLHHYFIGRIVELIYILGRTQIGKKGRFEPRTRDTSPPAVPTLPYCSIIRGNCDGKSGLACFGVLPRYGKVFFS